MRLGLLHTAATNVGIIDRAAAALAEPGLVLDHVVRTDLIAAAEAAGGLNAAISAETSRALSDLLGRNDRVLITCSSLGPLADGDRVLRIDAALAEQAVVGGGRVSVLCTSPTTLEATERLFVAAATRTGAKVRVETVDGAWALFRAGDIASYHRRIAEAAAQALDAGADMVALAQLSMSEAVAVVDRPEQVLGCAEAGLRSVLGLGRSSLPSS
ncbi:MAG: hypothetical protein ABS75_33385 [Pelagibacterium sp. SCN 63-23]|nr:MAG: hypothetical protein ABS75_33385 [Pelagibacterium sp. SCN 63-23]